MQNLGFKEHWFGYLASAGYILGIIVPYWTKSLTKRLGGYKKYLVFFLVLQLLLILSVFFANGLFLAIGIYIIFFTTYDFYGPVRSTFFQHFLPSKMRATISSFQSMLYSLVAIIAAPLAGFMADKIGPQNTISIGGLLLIPAIIIYLRINDSKVPKN